MSNPQALEGAQGFGETHAGISDGSAFEDIGGVWLFETVAHKFHACCHGLHAMLEALEYACEHVNPGEVARVSITAHPRWASVCNIATPGTGLEAKFSFRQTAAMAICGIDTAAMARFSDASVHDRKLIALRDRVEVAFDPDVTETAARVAVTLKDGSIRRGVHDLADPLPLATREEKLHAKAAALVGQGRARALWTAIGAGPDLPALLDALK